MENGSRHRLRQKDLVAMLFVLFSEEYDRSQADSISEIEIPMNRLRAHIAQETGIAYTGDGWITTQIHKYEEELGIPLFRRAQVRGETILGLSQDIRTYEQKHHLYVTQKIRAANGVFDLMHHGIPGSSGIVPHMDHHGGSEGKAKIRVLLEAGSTITRVAQVIAENLPSLDLTWDIATHNLGVLECLGKTAPAFRKVRVSVPAGTLDPVTNLILGENAQFYTGMRFDWIVQGTSFLSQGVVAVERGEEVPVKAGILAGCSGRKLLVLTGHEAVAHMPGDAIPFGKLGDFEYVVHPALPPDSGAARRLGEQFARSGLKLASLIRTWSYEILKVEGNTSVQLRN